MPTASRKWRAWGAARLRDAAAWLLRHGPDLLRRAYGLALMVLLIWVSYAAVHYLVVSLLRPSQTPPQISAVPRRLEAELLHGSSPDWLGLASVEHPRGPLSHFHRFESWYEEDRFNDCARGGCHAPLPHSKTKEVRAFLNLHATSMHCGVCHFEGAPAKLVWYDLRSGETRSRPALLDLLERMENRRQPPPDEAATRQEQRELGRALRRAAAENLGEPHLIRLAEQIEAVRPTSPAYERLLGVLRDAIRQALRGAYGAKLAVADGAGRPMLAHPGAGAAVREWLAQGAQLQGPARDTLLNAVHPLRRDTPLDCTDCHRPDGARLDFSASGYPEARIRTLQNAAIFTMIQHIREGRPFYLPTVGQAIPQSSSAPTRPGAEE